MLSRGLLLPKIVVSDFGGERSDAESLGTRIYFGLDASTSLKYSSPGEKRGSRLLLVCDVALGSVKVGWYVIYIILKILGDVFCDQNRIKGTRVKRASCNNSANKM